MQDQYDLVYVAQIGCSRFACPAFGISEKWPNSITKLAKPESGYSGSVVLAKTIICDSNNVDSNDGGNSSDYGDNNDIDNRGGDNIDNNEPVESVLPD